MRGIACGCAAEGPKRRAVLNGCAAGPHPEPPTTVVAVGSAVCPFGRRGADEAGLRRPLRLKLSLSAPQPPKLLGSLLPLPHVAPPAGPLPPAPETMLDGGVTRGAISTVHAAAVGPAAAETVAPSVWWQTAADCNECEETNGSR